MDIENLIERLNNYSAEYQRHGGITVEAADALSILRDENAKLRNSRDRWKKCAEEFSEGVNQRDNETEKLQAENEKLRAELGQAKQERNAAVEDLRVCSIENNMECQYCLYRTARSFCWNCTDGSNWQWRGPHKED